MANPIENLLRKPVEIYSSLTCLGSMGLVGFSPGLFYMNAATAWTASGVLLGLGLHRARQARRVIQYQRGLRVLPRYSLTGDQIPVSKQHQFLGRGFQWDKRHTVRLSQLREPVHVHLTRPTKLDNVVFKLSKHLEKGGEKSEQLRKFINQDHPINPFRPPPKVGGFSALHGVGMWEGEEDIWEDLSEAVGHKLVLGTTRVGKTRFAELSITQDIHRGDVVIVFDPKGDAELLIRMYIEAKRAGRLDKFYMFHLGQPDASDRYNPIDSYDRITEVATRVANQLPGEGQSQAFKEFVWRFVNVIAKSMQSLGDRMSYVELYRVAGAPGRIAIRYFEKVLDANLQGWRDEFDPAFDIAQEKKEEGVPDSDLITALRRGVTAARQTKRELRALALAEYIGHKEVVDDTANSLATMLTNDRSYFEKLVSSLYPLLEKLTTGRIAELISPNYDDPHDKRRIFTWSDIINTGGIVYVGLDSLSDYEVGSVVGNAMFSDLTSLAGKAYNFGFAYGQSNATRVKHRVRIHADEFNELVGDAFIPMCNKAGGAGYEITAYTQTRSDIEVGIGSAPKAEQLAGNFNTLIMLRVKTEDTAKMLTDLLPEISVPTKMPSSSASDTNDPGDFAEFGSKNEDRLQSEKGPMLTPSDLTQLPKGQAFALLHGGQLFKLRLPLPDVRGDVDVPQNLLDLAHSMRKTYNKFVVLDGESEEEIHVLEQHIDHELLMHQALDPVDAAIEAAGTGSHK